MVETPSSVLVESTTHDEIALGQSDEPSKKSSAPPAYSAVPASEPASEAPRREAMLVTSTPVTASLHTTIKHLRSIGGFASRFRGWNMWIVYSILVQQFTMLFSSMFGFVIGGVIAAAVMAIPRMTWVHIVISSPSPLPWYKRFPSKENFRTAFKKVTGLTVLVAIAEVGGAFIALALMPSMPNMQNGQPDHQSHHETTGDDEKDELILRVCMMQTGIAVLAWLAWSAFFTVPLTACLAKIQTSLLPEDEDTIVNTERSEDMTLAEAWRSFDWNARVRVYKAYAKFVAIQISIIMTFFIGIYFMFVAFLGWNWEETINQRMFATFYRVDN